MACIEEGLVSSIFFEGENTSRPEVINDMPKGFAESWFTLDEWNLMQQLGVIPAQ